MLPNQFLTSHKKLSLTHPAYRAATLRHTQGALQEDDAMRDVTTQSFFTMPQVITVTVVAKQSGVVAGISEIVYFLKSCTKLAVVAKVRDGIRVQRGRRILTLRGPVGQCMAVERVILNVLGRLSGVATRTAAIVEKAHAKNPRLAIAATRKTLLGLLDKRAVVVGGGVSHRITLSEAILIKHTHQKASGVSVQQYLRKTLANIPKSIKFVEIEVGNFHGASAAAEVFAQAKVAGLPLPCIIMLDNISPAMCKKVVRFIRTKYVKNICIEASGGINEKNIGDYAATGVDIISMGSLTTNTPFLDLSMRVV